MKDLKTKIKMVLNWRDVCVSDIEVMDHEWLERLDDETSIKKYVIDELFRKFYKNKEYDDLYHILEIVRKIIKEDPSSCLYHGGRIFQSIKALKRDKKMNIAIDLCEEFLMTMEILNQQKKIDFSNLALITIVIHILCLYLMNTLNYY